MKVVEDSTVAKTAMNPVRSRSLEEESPRPKTQCWVSAAMFLFFIADLRSLFAFFIHDLHAEPYRAWSWDIPSILSIPWSEEC